MADTNFSPAPQAVPPTTKPRDAVADYPRDSGLRVDASEKPDKPAPDREDARRAAAERQAQIERLAEQVLSNSRLSIKRDEQSGDFIYLMIDDDTGETVRRWPPESHGDLVDFLETQRAGLIDKRA